MPWIPGKALILNISIFLDSFQAHKNIDQDISANWANTKVRLSLIWSSITFGIKANWQRLYWANSCVLQINWTCHWRLGSGSVKARICQWRPYCLDTLICSDKRQRLRLSEINADHTTCLCFPHCDNVIHRMWVFPIFLALNAKEEYVFVNLLCFALIGYALRLVLDSLFDLHRYNGGDVRDFTSSEWYISDMKPCRGPSL